MAVSSEYLKCVETAEGLLLITLKHLSIFCQVVSEAGQASPAQATFSSCSCGIPRCNQTRGDI